MEILPMWELSALAQLRTKADRTPRLAVVGVGSPGRGDDAAGLVISRWLRRRCGSQHQLLILCTGPSPESYASVLRRFHPDHLIFIDSLEMGREPGVLAWLEAHDLARTLSPSGSLSLNLLAAYLEHEIGCLASLIGIQPGRRWGDRLSPAVRASLRRLAGELEDWLLRPAQPPDGSWSGVEQAVV
jgi:hydrogenase 3 maturation protease